jgi:hypothetical protein
VRVPAYSSYSARVPPRHLPFGKICGVASAVRPDLLLGQVELDDPGHGPGEELPVMTDNHSPGAQILNELLQPGQPVQIEVVRRLVEQEHVVAAEQQRGQRRPGGLPPGQGGHGLIELDGQPQAGHDRTGALVQVRAAERQPPVQLAGVGVIRAGRPRCQRVRGGLHRLTGRSDAGPAGQELPYRLVRPPLWFLRQVADGRVRGADRHQAGVGGAQAGQDAQQRRLARAVHADQADDISGPGHQVEARKQETVTVRGLEALGDERGAHHNHIPRAPSELPSARAARSAGPGRLSVPARWRFAVGGYPGQPAGGHEEGAAAVTESQWIPRSLRCQYSAAADSGG